MLHRDVTCAYVVRSCLDLFAWHKHFLLIDSICFLEYFNGANNPKQNVKTRYSTNYETNFYAMNEKEEHRVESEVRFK